MSSNFKMTGIIYLHNILLRCYLKKSAIQYLLLRTKILFKSITFYAISTLQLYTYLPTWLPTYVKYQYLIFYSSVLTPVSKLSSNINFCNNWRLSVYIFVVYLLNHLELIDLAWIVG